MTVRARPRRTASGARVGLLIVALAALLPQANASGHDAHRRPRAQIGKASYYGPRHGQPTTASGAKLHAAAMTAASPHLPLGTRAKVTNLKTGKSVPVVVTDRGPYAKGRILDVSRAAADHLGMKRDGVAPVVVKPLSKPPG